MISHLVDSDWLIDLLKAKDAAIHLLKPLIDDDSLALSVIVYGEVYEGVVGGGGRAKDLASFARMVSGMSLLGLDETTAQIFGDARSKLRRQGALLADNDLWIAATALRHDLTLVSRDSHFRRIPGLKLL